MFHWIIVENHISITEKAAVKAYEKILGSVYPKNAEIIATATCVSSNDKGLFLHWLSLHLEFPSLEQMEHKKVPEPKHE